MSEELTEAMPKFLQQSAGKGKESGVDAEDRQLPRVKLCQSNTEEVKNGDVDLGDIIHSVTSEKFSLPMEFIPIYYWKEYFKFNEDNELEYRTMDRNDPRIGNGLEWINGEKPKVQAFIQVLALPVETMEPIIIPFKSTSYKAGRQLLNIISMTKGDSFSRKYELSTDKAKKKGGEYSFFKIRPLSWVSEKQYQASNETYDAIVPAIKAGEVQAQEDANSDF